MTGDEDVYAEDTKKTTSTLTIATAAAENAGDYKCIASFSGTAIESNVAAVNVYGKGDGF